MSAPKSYPLGARLVCPKCGADDVRITELAYITTRVLIRDGELDHEKPTPEDIEYAGDENDSYRCGACGFKADPLTLFKLFEDTDTGPTLAGESEFPQ